MPIDKNYLKASIYSLLKYGPASTPEQVETAISSLKETMQRAEENDRKYLDKAKQMKPHLCLNPDPKQPTQTRYKASGSPRVDGLEIEEVPYDLALISISSIEQKECVEQYYEEIDLTDDELLEDGYNDLTDSGREAYEEIVTDLYCRDFMEQLTVNFEQSGNMDGILKSPLSRLNDRTLQNFNALPKDEQENVLLAVAKTIGRLAIRNITE